MSFVTALPEALAAAATQLEGIGNSFAAESSAAAAPTTSVAPAGADEVSILQSGVFSTYGQLYQSVSAEAQTIHQQFVNLLGQSSNSYGATESANQVAAGANSLTGAGQSAAAVGAQPSSIVDLLNDLTTFLGGSTGNSFNASSGFVGVPLDEVGNFASAYSDCIGMGGGGLLTALSGPTGAAADLGGLGAGLDGSVAPVAVGGAGLGGAGGFGGAAPVLAGVGQGSSIGALSTPPSWAAGVPATTSAPVTLAGQSWSTAAPTMGGATPGGMYGMPAVASGGRGGAGGFGAPRYGVKPRVMPAIAKALA
jgi:hypothetical protein